MLVGVGVSVGVGVGVRGWWWGFRLYPRSLDGNLAEAGRKTT